MNTFGRFHLILKDDILGAYKLVDNKEVIKIIDSCIHLDNLSFYSVLNLRKIGKALVAARKISSDLVNIKIYSDWIDSINFLLTTPGYISPEGEFIYFEDFYENYSFKRYETASTYLTSIKDSETGLVTFNDLSDCNRYFFGETNVTEITVLKYIDFNHSGDSHFYDNKNLRAINLYNFYSFCPWMVYDYSVVPTKINLISNRDDLSEEVFLNWFKEIYPEDYETFDFSVINFIDEFHK